MDNVTVHGVPLENKSHYYDHVTVSQTQKVPNKQCIDLRYSLNNFLGCSNYIQRKRDAEMYEMCRNTFEETGISARPTLRTTAPPLLGSQSGRAVMSRGGRFSKTLQIWLITGSVLDCSCSLPVTWLITALIPLRGRFSELQSAHTPRSHVC